MQSVVIVGGSGFIGSAVVAALAGQGREVLVLTRDPARLGHLQLLPGVSIVGLDVFAPDALVRQLRAGDRLVNLVGVLHSAPGVPWGPAFERAHVALPRILCAAAVAAGVERFVHISALGADEAGPSEYQRSKAAGEAVIRATPGLRWCILRPSVVFGPRDHFLNLFAALTALPILPLAGAHTRFQPVFVGDVARCVLRCLEDPAALGASFELAGPDIHTLAQLVGYVAQLRGRRTWIVALPEGLALLQAACFERLPNPLMSRDNVRSLRVDNIASGAPLPFGWQATSLHAVAPAYLTGGRHRYFDVLRRHARRSGR